MTPPTRRWRTRVARPPAPRTYSVTSARRSLSEDLDSRARRYFVSMSIRTGCFLLAVVTEGPLRWAFVVGSLVLPYIAVVIANAGREPGGRPDEVVLPSRIELTARSAPSIPVTMEAEVEDAAEPPAQPQTQPQAPGAA